ncbi:hypothetical protein HPP92_004486 [Vanilla planifolia]|uniref:G domain-containing protein n=1 Tax=Vanilla planifolia TaxID=51239 RepID=A0A835RSP6_VANPL|nr:hypothetical protein HPP92_004861 [Vanilla planifolia]KAG0493492.1 hypothetical protein HPP92_004486 [Vanilla planifolia]
MAAPIPLLLKLAAATATGTAALLSLRHNHRLAVIRSLRRDIHDALVLLRACDGRSGETSGAPPAILVTGFRGHGKSAFINTACRALAGESGPLLLRSVTAPLGFPPATVDRWNVRVAVAGSGGGCEEHKVAVDECVAVELIDAPPLPDPVAMTLVDVEAAFDVGSGRGERLPECVVLVLRCNQPAMERHLTVRRVGDIAGVARDRGLRVVVVLTNRRSLRSRKQAEQLRCEVAVGPERTASTSSRTTQQTPRRKAAF